MTRALGCVGASVIAALNLAASPALAQATATYTYDALGRVTGVSTAAGTVTYTYDNADNRTAYVASAAGGNHAPVAYDDGSAGAPIAVASGAATVIPVLSNDLDADNDTITVNSVSGGAKGVPSITSGAGSVTYTPTAGQTGADSFTYTAKDSHGAVSNAATVYVSISAGAPVAGTVNQHVAYNSGANSIALNVTGSYTTATVVTAATKGVATASGAAISYTPNTNASGLDSFQYKVTGSGGVSNTATANITIDLPAAPSVANGSITTAYNTQGSTALSITGSYASVQIASQGAKGTAAISGTTALYTPNPGTSGADSFTVTATGTGGTSPPATISVSIAAPPIAPSFTPTAGYYRLRTTSGWGPATAVVVSATGGSGTYTYSWAYQSGATGFIIDSQTSNTVTWLKAGALTPGDFKAVWRCTITDSLGTSVYVDVPVEIEEDNGS